MGVDGLGVCGLGVMVLCGLGQVGPWVVGALLDRVEMVGADFPESCFSILSMEDHMEATWATKELMVLFRDLNPSRISGEALALHVCDTTVWGCNKEKEGMDWTG